LIMLLDADHIVPGDELVAVNHAAGESMKPLPNIDSGASPKKSTSQHAVANERQFVTFRLADGEYGIPINEIQEIDRSSKMTRIPKAPEYVDGVTNLRGEVIPVINARKRFNLPLKEVDERTRVIIIDVAGTKTGLLVDSVREVLNLAESEIAPPPATVSSGVHQQYISGVGKADGGKRMLVLLDVAKVVCIEV
jgi:purine-binding chemotaxis protein CheW